MNTPKLLISSAVAFALCLFAASVVNADIITAGGYAPTGTVSFGSLPAATFGGSGIPNNAVQIVQQGGITLGLTATGRYSNPTPTNDGAGTFFANAGGDTLDSAPTLAQWNFDYYVSGVTTNETTRLFVDNNPAAGNDVTQSFNGFSFNYQDSQNLGFAAFSGGTFNPTVAGEYGFSIVVYDVLGQKLASDSIIVKVGSDQGGGRSVPDGGSTIALLGGTLIGLATVRRRFVR